MAQVRAFGKASTTSPHIAPLNAAGHAADGVLPFVLPLLGAATGATLGIVTSTALAIPLTLDAIAALAVIATLRRLWRLRHPRRWQYLPVALALTVLLGVFLANDARSSFV